MKRTIHLCLLFSTGLLITSAGPAYAASWETTSLRAPGGGLVRIGMTRQEVIRELAPPPSEQSGAQKKPVSQEKPRGKNSPISYRGDDGLYIISFSGERVVKIVVTPKRD